VNVAGAGTPTGARILVFIPCYNCAPQVGRVLAQVSGPVARYVDEVLVLDNGSGDSTPEAAIAAAPAVSAPVVTVGRNLANYNLGGSHKSAYAYAEERGFTHVVTLHGDDQGNLADLLPLLEAGRHLEADACLGSRFARGARLTNYSAVRILGNRVFNLIFSAASGRWITDLGSGLNILARKAYADPELLRLPDDLHFNAYLLLDLYDRSRRVCFFPISWREEDQVSNVKMASQALKMLAAAARFFFARGGYRRRDYRAVRHTAYRFGTLARFEGGRRVA
jgi:glycosyltransferase involved in cell wall biosynthesis